MSTKRPNNSKLTMPNSWVQAHHGPHHGVVGHSHQAHGLYVAASSGRSLDSSGAMSGANGGP